MGVREDLETNGFVIVKDVYSDDDVAEMRQAMERIVAETDLDQHPRSVFSTYDEDKHAADDYFMNSSDKIRFFFEEGAVAEDGTLKVPKMEALNKVGHGLHFLDPTFRKMTFHPKIRDIFAEVGYQKPKVVQSMYIFKQKRIGGAVTDHVDATFLRADPVEHLLGVWIAVDDAEIRNGCLAFIPGSHKESTALDYRFVRTHSNSGALLKFTGTKPTYDASRFVPIPIRKGSLLLIHGLVVHKSEPNTSDASRHAYTFHVMEGQNTRWSPDNWLQQTEDYKFSNLYTTNP